jgi:hypothetical protein
MTFGSSNGKDIRKRSNFVLRVFIIRIYQTTYYVI